MINIYIYTFQVEIEKCNQGFIRELKKKKFEGRACPPHPTRSLRLRCSFRKSVSIYPRSAPAQKVDICFAQDDARSVKSVLQGQGPELSIIHLNQ